MQTHRRKFLTSAATAAFTSSLFTGRVRGANDRIAMGFIGLGMQGTSNLHNALAAKNQAQVVALCDIYQPALEKAAATVRAVYGSPAKEIADFREVLANKSIDAVCISTPDHWHALMTVEACKAGKDVYVEKPACTVLDEGPKMIEAARKYNRVVQGGNMQRSMPTFVKALEWVKSGVLGEITWAKVWAAGLGDREGHGNPPDTTPPPGLDWDMWLGPAPMVAFNQNRWGVDGKHFPTFRYFWDYAGGEMTDWGIHFIDPVHQFLGEPVVESVVSLGGRFWFHDNLQTADTMAASFEYPKFMMNYELRQSSPVPILGQNGATAVLGTEGSVVVTRGGAWLNPVVRRGPQAPAPKFEAQEFHPPARPAAPPSPGPHIPPEASEHWQNFLECVRTRQRPVADIEYLVRSTASCLLANVSMRAKVRCDLDPVTLKVKQAEARPFTEIRYRAPWKLEV